VERRGERQFATMAELVKLAEAVPARYRALILVAGLAGLRQGELFALRRSDVDLDQALVHVRRKRQRLASGEVLEGPPKSEAGIRSVALPAPLVSALQAHLDRFTGRSAGAYVFTAPGGEPLEANNFRNRIWNPARDACGLEGLRFHDLRHSAGTLAARTGATTRELMARLGHASAQAAMTYQHAAEERDRWIAEGLGEMAREAGL
jgi:integrase